MGITKRIRDIWTAGVHDKLDALESPESLIKQYLRDLESDLAKAEDAIRSHLMIEKRQERLVSETEAFITKRERQAKLAIETGQDQIAKLALQDKFDYEPRLAVYREQLDVIQGHTTQLFEQFKELKTKYAELQQKKIVLLSRANAAASIDHVNRTLSSLDAGSALRGFERMEHRIAELEASAQATHRLRTLSVPAAPAPDVEFNVDVETAFAKLKAEQKEPTA
ncbi:phage shock protein A (PspA) family protein [Tumebacillus sp. BK434]|uniref:PspA/IM30 family protein n=1 Tax=Tumebacillus sp. BK434 TaxID=2512169 RepID=UPI00104B6869|nr:PspA/IM30 family protein [Tumebacillus sp. BK434]TCP55817.1 phage shock protein A (PspA) family protein [Tumebacillus sp. BK434]